MTIIQKLSVAGCAGLLSSAAVAAETQPQLDVAANGFIMICAALVIIMSIPGIALFYGGMVRSKNMLSIMIQSIVCFSLMYILWAFFGYSLAMGTENDSFIHLFYGDFSKIFLKGISVDTVDSNNLSELCYFSFQGAFAAITACLILGSFAERIKFSGLLVVMPVWFVLAYIPSWHMVWGGGWLDSSFGVLDFAGGTVVHINASICGLVGAYFVGRRIGYGKESMAPHSLTITMIGTCLLWFGWFGFNAGSSLSPDGTSVLAFTNTVLAPAAGVLSWMTLEWIVSGKPSMLGACSGAIAGLVAITPACGYVGIVGGICIGIIAGMICYWGVNGLKRMLNVDDSLDVFGVHGVGGITGAILTGIFCSPELGGTGFGNGNETILQQVVGQSVSVVVTVIWTAAVAYAAFFAASKLTGIRVQRDQEREGLDLAYHGERAYNH
jgi:Amt family ammonium transporter